MIERTLPRRPALRSAGLPGLMVVPEPPPTRSFAAVVARVLRCRRCSLMLADDDGNLLVEESVGLPTGVDGAARAALDASVAGLVAQSRTPLLVNSSADRAGWPHPVGVYAEESFVSFPIELPDGTVGVVNATDREDGSGFGPADLAVLADLTRFYASTFDAPARRDVRRLRAELRRERARFIQRQESERQRLARELHDDAGHALTAAILRLDMAAGRLIGQGELTDALGMIREALVECAEHLHDLAFELQPRLLADLGLAPALRSLARRIRELGLVEVELVIDGDERRLQTDTELATFRIAQEAATNVLKHAGAGKLTFAIAFAPDQVVLDVLDDGDGFAPAEPGDGGRSRQGLNGMRERAELVGGVLEVLSRPGAGTTIRALLPDRSIS